MLLQNLIGNITLKAWMLLLPCLTRITAAPKDGYYQIYSNTKPPLREENSTSRWYFKVLGTTDSSISVSCTLVSYRTEMNDRLFNTTDPVTCRPISSTDLEMLSLLNRSFLYTLKKEGVADQQTVGRIFEERIASWQIEEGIGKMMMQNAKSFLAAEMRALFQLLSKDNKGLLTDSVFRYNITDINNQPVQEVTITRLDAKEVNIPPLNEEVETAIVTASHFSHVLYEAPLFDSAKVGNYFKRYDPVYGSANFYRLIKLDLLAANIMANMDRYDSLLLVTADSILAPYPQHLFNKAQKVKNISVDSAYQTIRYLSKDRHNFQSWVQQSFSQEFLHHITPEEIRVKLKENGVTGKKADEFLNDAINSGIISKILIEKLAHDKDTTIRYEVYPAYLWVQAMKYSSNTDSVVYIAGELEKVSDSKVYGNPHRYGLLLYKQLLASGNAREAAHLLDNQIAGMERRVNDSADHDRYAEQNILSYAYKLKSDAVKATDPRAAMTYLSKAAGYSPGSQKEKVYTSFYDRTFLDSKESYRPEFAEALIRQGNTKDGLVVLSEQLNADPSFIGDLQQAFVRNFPQKDFYRFFNEGVAQSWKSAPDFSLKSPDGTTFFKLEDYRGKWLLIDFWGTWCGPCREEMPKINEFVKKNENRKDLAFLSIACRDTKENVIRYLADNNYHVPVSMSDNTVERKFEVPYYPSKFLISPAGTILPIAFGLDWQKIVEQFIALRPKKIESKMEKGENN
ncbi:MAG TPA: TlpA disulfide reductase family protein [Puia sp.]|nr:TlpA disulfide reductase family protein [Puia sp.]